MVAVAVSCGVQLHDATPLIVVMFPQPRFETPLFKKSAALFNFGPARKAVHGGATLIAVEGYIDVKLAVSESRYTNWPPALQQQFAAARTVEPGKPSFTLTIEGDAQ